MEGLADCIINWLTDCMQRKEGFLPEFYCWFPCAAVCVWLALEGFYRACFAWLTPMLEEVSLLHYAAWLIDTQGDIDADHLADIARIQSIGGMGWRDCFRGSVFVSGWSNDLAARLCWHLTGRFGAAFGAV